MESLEKLLSILHSIGELKSEGVKTTIYQTNKMFPCLSLRLSLLILLR